MAGKYEYHFSGSKTSTSLDEPLYLTKWRATFVLPKPLQAKYGSEIMYEQIKKVGGFQLDKLPETVEQFFRMHKRRFIGTVVDTNIDLEMEFEVNVTKNGIIYPYNVLRDWCRLGYDPLTGYQTIKEDYVGKLTFEVHNKVGTILRKFYSPIIFPITPPAAFEFDYTSEANYNLAVTFAAENYTDLLVEGKV